jgi:hypothetical protein
MVNAEQRKNRTGKERKICAHALHDAGVPDLDCHVDGVAPQPRAVDLRDGPGSERLAFERLENGSEGRAEG